MLNIRVENLEDKINNILEKVAPMRVKKRNNKGPRKLPCGSPQLGDSMSKVQEKRSTLKSGFFMKCER